MVDPRDGSLQASQDVHIAGDRIASVGPAPQSAGAEPPPGAQAVDATGQFLVPGFADMHAHMHSHPLAGGDPSGGFDLMLAHGVTGFRQMSGSARMLKERAAGTLTPAYGPRLLAMPGAVLSPLNAGTPDAAVAAVREQHEQGADFIKAALVTPEVFYQAQLECQRLGIAILGHLPNGIDVARACGEGVRSVEHLGPGVSLLACCSADQDAVRQEVEAAARPGPRLPPARLPFLEAIFDRLLRKIIINPANISRPEDIAILEHAAATFGHSEAAALAARFVRDGTWQVPTLIRSRTTHLCDDPVYRNDPALRYVAPSMLRDWTKATAKFRRFPAESRQTFRAVYAVLLILARLLDEAGVKMLAGSDSGGASWEIPGQALHQEFDELARAGLPPLRVLQMTTWNAAEVLDRTDVMGTVAAGKYADLVLLNANPLESTDHLHLISGVVRGGRYFPQAELEAIKEKVAAARSVR
ncbi:MAG: amidohydrolase family protein [Streptosporangiaceae bacterium]